MQELLLEMTNITKQFPGVKALDKACLRVKPGSVHALMGENGAGKSTLMKCLYGIYHKDGGTIVLDGQEVNFKDSKDAIDHGVSMIHQELQPIPRMTVAENIFLGNYPLNSFHMVNHEQMNSDTRTLLNRVGLDVSPTDYLGDLTISQQQSVEIAKAISHNAKIVIMDEPTSSLTENEVEKLFSIIRSLTAQGISIIYISHKMDEILNIADEVTIMRDGQYVGSYAADTLTTDDIIRYMVGRELTNQFPPRSSKPSDEVVLKVEHFSSPSPHSFQDCSFELHKGEILGLGGLVGAQRTELMEALYGLRTHLDGGTLQISGKTAPVKAPRDAISDGIALVTEDRRKTGIFAVLPVEDNVAIASVDQYVNKLGLLNLSEIAKVVKESISALSIKTPSGKTLVRDLSGGNQQKVILSRWLANSPDILILDEPTRGIDVGAKYEIYQIIDQLAAAGKAIIMVTSEMAELLGMSDRIMVMCEGRISGFLDPKEATQEDVMALATRFMTTQKHSIADWTDHNTQKEEV